MYKKSVRDFICGRFFVYKRVFCPGIALFLVLLTLIP